jgi:2-polyprenyl-6-methoxyphenol hydroxylase-like FAD-dependent oxidoreductase
MTPSIAILGAGPSGLALARLLELKGIDYIVFDRDPSANVGNQGGTLDLRSDSGQEVLRAAGLFAEFEKIARYEGQAFKAMDKDCNIVWNKKYTGQKDAPEIDRKDLKTLLVDALPSEKIQWNARVERVVRAKNGSMTIHFTDGTVRNGFRLVVGADGAWSKVRPMVCRLFSY